MKLPGRKQAIKRHIEVERALNIHDKKLERMARRLRRLELEAGIVKPPLRGVDDFRSS